MLALAYIPCFLGEAAREFIIPPDLPTLQAEYRYILPSTSRESNELLAEDKHSTTERSRNIVMNTIASFRAVYPSSEYKIEAGLKVYMYVNVRQL